MVTTSKSYMNFLGGEVSPNAYKRLDMANNGKWFETAKNIYFGTTGDFQNRRGFVHIGELPEGQPAGEKLKFIPFVFNREESYCIVFFATGFSILKNGSYIVDDNNNKIVFPHPGFSFSSERDISYCQIGDVVYIASRNDIPVFTITRKSDTEWVWNKFNYFVPPMQKINKDSKKTLSFAVTQASVQSYKCSFDLSNIYFTIDNPTVSLEYYSSGLQSVTLIDAQSSFTSVASLASYFNANNAHNEYVTECKANGQTLEFYLTQAAYNLGGANNVGIRISADGNIGSARETSSYFVQERYEPTGDGGWYYYLEYAIDVPSDACISEADITYVKASQYYTKTYILDSFLTRSQFISYINNAILSETGQSFAPGHLYFSAKDDSSVKIEGSGSSVYIGIPRFTGNATIRYTKPISSPGQNIQNPGFSFGNFVLEEVSSELKQQYNVTANFEFFSNKQQGDIFSVDSLYSPNRDGAPGQNKTIYITSGWNDIANSTTDSFWSNGNWRFLTSGLFEGSIELQYSYDGENWVTHRNFTSTVRTQNNVSYSTNYNEYGSIDADDNILLRLKFSIDPTKATNLCVMLDTESFKNRSYYKVISKTSNTQALVENVCYSVGTPGITTFSEGSYLINPIYEWAESSWSPSAGYPKVVFFYQNRLGFANTKTEPFAIWFSKTDDFLDFSTKVEYQDDDPITIKAMRASGTSEVNAIASAKSLFIFCADNESGLKDDGALTQANKQLIDFTFYGSEPLEIKPVANKIIFVERGGRAARAINYDFSQDNYNAVDLTVPYKHLLTDETIVSTDYIPGDYNAYLMLTSAGRILCFKYVPEQRIEACSWFKHANGFITNICVIPSGNSYYLYIAINSGSHKFIEYININNFSAGGYLDSLRDYSFESVVSSVTDTTYFVPGVKYTVLTQSDRYSVTADENCSILLQEPTTSITVGVQYTSEATLIEPNLLLQKGTTNYNRKNMFKAYFTYENSVGFKVGIKNRDHSFKQVYALDAETVEGQFAPTSGERNFILQSSYLEPNMLSFVQEEPYKMHITNAEVDIDYGGK